MHQSRSRSRFPLALTVFVFPLFSLGCMGGNDVGATIDASGKVTLQDGKPLSSASIRFTSQDSGATYEAELQDDGTYEIELQDTHEGEVFGVSFGPSQPTSDSVELDEAGLPKSPPPPPIEAKYLEHATSGLTASIGTESSATFDFQL